MINILHMIEELRPSSSLGSNFQDNMPILLPPLAPSRILKAGHVTFIVVIFAVFSFRRSCIMVSDHVESLIMSFMASSVSYKKRGRLISSCLPRDRTLDQSARDLEGSALPQLE